MTLSYQCPRCNGSIQVGQQLSVQVAHYLWIMCP